MIFQAPIYLCVRLVDCLYCRNICQLIFTFFLQEVHAWCKQKSHICRICYKLLRVLPCVICKQTISPGEDFAEEFKASLPHRLPCCKADCHPKCKEERKDVYRCPVCQCPLINWEIDRDMVMAGDYLAGRRSEHLNDIRRRDNLPYSVTPQYKPILNTDCVW